MKKNINEEKMNGPKVVFRDLELQVSVGQWLEIISSQISFGSSGMTISMPLSAKELMARIMIPKKKLNEVSKAFGYLLGLAGIPLDETCVLSLVDSDEFIFKCYLTKAKCEYPIKLRWGCFLDSFPELTIEYPNEQRVYEYFGTCVDKQFRFHLQEHTIKSDKNDNVYNRFYSKYSCYFALKNKDYHLSLRISIPEELRVSDKDCVLRNEEALKTYFLGLEFPIDINEVYKKICELSLDSINVYPEFELKVEKKVDGNSSVVTDMINLVNGQLQNYTITKGGKTISLDGEGNWSYVANQVSISYAKNGEINYSLTGFSRDGLETISAPAVKYDMISEEIEEVKNLVKSLQNKRN